MRLVCPSCRSQYEVDEALFPEEGREVQCSNCEEVWVQYPVEEQQPIRLDPLARVQSDPMPAAVPAAAPARPSERLEEEERGALAQAVRDEITALGGVTRDQAPPPVQRKAPPPDNSAPDDDDILAALRKQIALEGGDFEKAGAPKTQKRNLKVAAQAVGIDVDDTRAEETDSRPKWNLSEAEAKPGRAAPPPKRKEEPLKKVRRQYEHEMGAEPREGGGARKGFILGLLLVVIGVSVYMMRAELAGAYPPAAPYLDSYAAWVDQNRRLAEEIYAKYSPIVAQQIDALTGGGEEG